MIETPSPAGRRMSLEPIFVCETRRAHTTKTAAFGKISPRCYSPTCTADVGRFVSRLLHFRALPRKVVALKMARGGALSCVF